MRHFRWGLVWIALSIGLTSIVGCSSGGGSAPTTTATVPLTEAELAAFNDFVDNGTLLNQNGRRCIATPFLRAYGIEKLRAFGKGTPLADSEAEQTYNAFKGCFDPRSVFDVYYPPERSTDQLRCLRESGPPETEAKRLLVGLFQGTKMSLTTDARAKVDAAVTKCMGR